VNSAFRNFDQMPIYAYGEIVERAAGSRIAQFLTEMHATVLTRGATPRSVRRLAPECLREGPDDSTAGLVML
jgi:hypothetical protein